jgi:hypothetical protein
MADKNPKSFADAARMQKAATESLNEVRRGKAAAEATPAGADLSAANAEKAKRERWATTTGSIHKA